MKKTNKTYIIPPVRVEDATGKGLEILAKQEKRTFTDYIRYRLSQIVETELEQEKEKRHG